MIALALFAISVRNSHRAVETCSYGRFGLMPLVFVFLLVLSWSARSSAQQPAASLWYPRPPASRSAHLAPVRFPPTRAEHMSMSPVERAGVVSTSMDQAVAGPSIELLPPAQPDGEEPAADDVRLYMSAQLDPLPWEVFAQGEYIGPARTVHMAPYHLRVDDRLEFVYRFTHEPSDVPYRMNVGDQLIVESVADETLNRGNLAEGRGLVIQPDGTINLRLLGKVPVAGRTIEEIRSDLERRYRKYYTAPGITVTPAKINTALEDLRDSIDSRYGEGGQIRQARVTPEGTIQLPAIGSVPAHGLTLDELKQEIEQRYREMVGPGVEVTPVLVERAPRFVYVLGEVFTPGRYELQGPTSVMQAIAMAGSWRNGGDLRQIIIFRRTEDWRLTFTTINMSLPLLGKQPCLAHDIWLRDSDVVLIPKSPVLRSADLIDLIFTRGLYGVLPFGYSITHATTL